MRRLLCFALVLVGLAVSPTQASHIFATNVTINGTPLAAGNATTNPTITVNPGDLITFSFDLFDTDPSATSFADTLNVSFGASSGTLPAPANASFAYLGNGTSGTPVNFSFTRTYGSGGTYIGSLTPDFPVSFPDYIFPGGAQSSQQQLPFTIVVTPEPATLAVFGGLALAGLAGYRRRKVKATA